MAPAGSKMKGCSLLCQVLTQNYSPPFTRLFIQVYMQINNLYLMFHQHKV